MPDPAQPFHPPFDPTLRAARHLEDGTRTLVLECRCGAIHVRIGELNLRLTPRDFYTLADTLNEAVFEHALATQRSQASPARGLA